MKPQDYKDAVGRLSILRYFPPEPAARAEVMALLARMVDRQDGLTWLVDTMINHVGEWPGPKELRAIYCTKFKPADGVEEWSAQPGFTAGDIEAENVDPARAIAERTQPRIKDGLKRVPAADVLKRLQ